MMFEKPQIFCHSEISVNYTVHDVKWVPFVPKFLSVGQQANGEGIIEIFEMNNGQFNSAKFIRTKYGIKCCTFGASCSVDKVLATGNMTGSLEFWDFNKPELPVNSYNGHRKAINCIDGVGGLNIGYGAPEIVTGSRDGCVMVWDPRRKDDPVATIKSADKSKNRDCWSVTFGNNFNGSERMVAAGYDNGDLKVFDLRTMKEYYHVNLKNGVCCVEFDRKDIKLNKLVATTLESNIHVFDVHLKPHPEKGCGKLVKKAHNSTIWQVKHLPQNRDIFMTTGGSGSLNLWKYEYPAKRVKLDADDEPYSVIGDLAKLQQCNQISNQPISSFEWSKTKLGLALCASFDQVIRVLIVTKLQQFH